MPPKLRTFKVTGAGQFPIDMLRYDACWPATEADAGKLQFDSLTETQPTHRRTITLQTHDPNAPHGGSLELFPLEC